ADGGVRQPEAARGTGRTQISRGPRRLAVREFRALVTGLRLAVHADPPSPLSDHRRGGWAAAQGLGVTRVLHYQCADAINDGSLRIILANFEVEPLPVHLLHATRGALPAKLRVFLDFAAARLREGLSSL